MHNVMVRIDGTATKAHADCCGGWAAPLKIVNERSFKPMELNRTYLGLLSIGLGAYAIAKRNIGVGPAALIRPQFYITGFPAVLLGVSLVGLGVLVLLLRE